MISKSTIKFIRSLEQKKFRNEHKLFVAEGHKIIGELIKQKWPIEQLFATNAWEGLKEYKNATVISESDLEKISFQKTPQQVLAVCKIVEHTINYCDLKNVLCLALDDVQDPGNTGTIIRISDWFGIKHIFAGTGTAELYNPKVIQATMGAFTRVTVFPVDLNKFIKTYKTETMLPVFGTLLNGKNIYKEKLQPNGMIVMGSEGKGICKDIQKMLTNTLYIPPFPGNSETSDSLNVATATAIVCAEFRRQLL
jgi:RNA methyltransferase, TrmH family